jgi:predicted nucleic acid-binding protein
MAAAEPREYRQYKYAWELAVKEGKLVLPIKRDWPAIGQILHLLAQERKRAASGKAPKRTPTAKQEMLADVMIAVSAARAGVIVVTDDNDFAAIQRAHNSMEFTSVRDFLALARGESKEV